MLIPGLGLEPRPPALLGEACRRRLFERGVLPGRSRIVCLSMSRGARGAAMLSKPLVCASTLDPPDDDRAIGSDGPSRRRSGARCPRISGNAQAKAAVISTASITALEAREGLSLSDGASIPSRSSSSWASPLVLLVPSASETTKGDRLGRPR